MARRNAAPNATVDALRSGIRNRRNVRQRNAAGALLLLLLQMRTAIVRTRSRISGVLTVGRWQQMLVSVSDAAAVVHVRIDVRMVLVGLLWRLFVRC